MSDKKEELAKIVGSDNVFDDPATLEIYSKDESFAPPMRASLVVKPQNAGDVKSIVRWANRSNAPIVPVSSGRPHFRGDTVPGVAGAVVIDMSCMKRIIHVNRRNRIAIVEPGVTFEELQAELAKEGLKLPMPLLPRPNKSVVAAFLEREPTLVPKYHWDMAEPLRSLQVVWGNGEQFTSGDAGEHGSLEKQWSRGLAQACGMGPFQVDYHRLLSGGQGTMGIVTWAAIKCEILPRMHKLFFVPGSESDRLLDFVYKVLRYRYADELLLLNNANLAAILGSNPGQIKKLRHEMPPMMAIVGIAGRDRLPEERVAFQEEDIKNTAQQSGLSLQSAIPGADSTKLLEALTVPSREPYWKLRNKGACQELFFLTTLDKTPNFVKTMRSVAEAWDYPVEEIGVYIQPVVQGVGCHCEFDLPFDPRSEKEAVKVKDLLSAASAALSQEGAFFSRPYGAWAEMAYGRDAQSTMVLRKIKNIFDPNHIMNPGKLCFQMKEI